MNLHILFIQRAESYPNQYAPEALLVWDEYAMSENPEGFDEACASVLETHGNSIVAHRVIRFSVDQDEIRELLIGTATVDAKLLG